MPIKHLITLTPSFRRKPFFNFTVRSGFTRSYLQNTHREIIRKSLVIWRTTTWRLEIDLSPPSRSGARREILVTLSEPTISVPARRRISNISHSTTVFRRPKQEPRRNTALPTTHLGIFRYYERHINVRVVVFRWRHHFIHAAIRETRSTRRERREHHFRTIFAFTAGILSHQTKMVFNARLQPSQLSTRGHRTFAFTNFNFRRPLRRTRIHNARSRVFVVEARAHTLRIDLRRQRRIATSRGKSRC